MNDFARYALVARLVAKLRESGSWASRTHIQKCFYFVQRLFRVPKVFSFVMYHYGPYSLELEADIQQMRSLGIFELEILPPYGPRYNVTDAAGVLFQRFGDELKDLETAMDFVVREFGSSVVTDLELLATAEFVQEEQSQPLEDMLAEVLRLKPHFSEREVKEAVKRLQQIRSKAATSH